MHGLLHEMGRKIDQSDMASLHRALFAAIGAAKIREVNIIAQFETGNRNRLFWRLQFLSWSVTALVSLGLAAYWPAGQAIVLGFSRALFGLLVTSFILRPILRKVRKHDLRLSPMELAVILLTCGILSLGDTAFIAGLAHLLQANMEQTGMQQFLSFSIILRWVLYLFWCVLYFGVHYWLDTQDDKLRVAQTEAAMRSSELQVLRAQVNPHFLFNALNSILAESSNAAAVQRITLALSDYLRFSLRQQNDLAILNVEMTALENYLCVEKARFEEKLEYSIQSDEPSRQTLAPVALIQPLLENAIKYGQLSNIRPLKIRIASVVEDGLLVVTVTNSGEWVQTNSQTSTGIGLSNLRRRLHLLYGERASLTITAENGEVCARAILPLTSKGIHS